MQLDMRCYIKFRTLKHLQSFLDLARAGASDGKVYTFSEISKVYSTVEGMAKMTLPIGQIFDTVTVDKESFFFFLHDQNKPADHFVRSILYMMGSASAISEGDFVAIADLMDFDDDTTGEFIWYVCGDDGSDDALHSTKVGSEDAFRLHDTEISNFWEMLRQENLTKAQWDFINDITKGVYPLNLMNSLRNDGELLGCNEEAHAMAKAAEEEKKRIEAEKADEEKRRLEEELARKRQEEEAKRQKEAEEEKAYQEAYDAYITAHDAWKKEYTEIQNNREAFVQEAEQTIRSNAEAVLKARRDKAVHDYSGYIEALNKNLSYYRKKLETLGVFKMNEKREVKKKITALEEKIRGAEEKLQTIETQYNEREPFILQHIAKKMKEKEAEIEQAFVMPLEPEKPKKPHSLLQKEKRSSEQKRKLERRKHTPTDVPLTPTQLVKESIKAEILEAMRTGHACTISEFLELNPNLAEYPSQRIIALFRQLVSEGKLKREVIQGKAYFSLT